MPYQQLIYDRNFIPLLTLAMIALAKDLDDGIDDNETEFEQLQELIEMVPTIERFDCNALNQNFVMDTAVEKAPELEQTDGEIRLPFNQCVFMFDDTIVIAKQIDRTTRCWCFPIGEKNANEMSAEDLYSWLPGCLSPIDLEPGAKTLTYLDKGKRHPVFNAAVLIVGVLELMAERLLNIEPNSPAPPNKFIDAKRARKGKPPLNPPYRTITLNLAETRRRTAGVRLNKHESPRLHWRRGHWRTIFRLSEFERQVWVKKCLVGDPSKGYGPQPHHYRAVWQPTIH